MSDTTINLCGNSLLKPVKMHFSGNTEIFGFKKVHQFFHGVQNSFLCKNWYSWDFEEPVLPKKKVKSNFLKKHAIFDQKLHFFLDFLEIPSPSLETHFSYHYNIKTG